MRQVTIIEAKPEHAELVIPYMRGRAIQETARLGLDADKLLQRALSRADFAWMGLLDNRPVCMWGVEAQSVLGNDAYLWLVTTDEVEEHPFYFLRRSQIFIKQLSTHYSMIHGHVDSSFERSIKWLKWLGFKVSPGLSVSTFEMRAEWTR